jgi:hypothetical protein
MNQGRPIGVGMLVAAASLVLSGCFASGSTAPTATKSGPSSCSTRSGQPTVVLSYTTPTPTISVRVGQRFVVSVPPWHWGHDTEISNHHPGVARQICDFSLNDGGRWAEFRAMAVGRDVFWAGVTPPSDLFMPSWSGRVTVMRG